LKDGGVGAFSYNSSNMTCIFLSGGGEKRWEERLEPKDFDEKKGKQKIKEYKLCVQWHPRIFF